MPDGTTGDNKLLITDNAAARIATLREMEGKPGLMLRVTVSGGGCSGFQYGFDLDDSVGDEDVTFEHNGIAVVTDAASLDLMSGSEVDFVENLGGAYFQIQNPQATSSCGCGASFSIF